MPFKTEVVAVDEVKIRMLLLAGTVPVLPIILLFTCDEADALLI